MSTGVERQVNINPGVTRTWALLVTRGMHSHNNPGYAEGMVCSKTTCEV